MAQIETAPPVESPQDTARRTALTSMKRLAGGLLVLMALIFTVSFALQERYPWLEYVRAAAEGGMVGAIADWFAVTALFRYPLGLRIPHTNIIANRKDEIGASLGEFVETNFLSEAVIRGKLESVHPSRRLGAWLSDEKNAEKLTDELAVAGQGLLNLLGDDAIKNLIESVAREHLVKPEWGPSLGRVGERLVTSGQQHAAVDLLLDRADGWLRAHPQAFGRVVSQRLPTWLPGFVDKLVDDKAYREVLAFVASARQDRQHPVRKALDDYLSEVMHDLQYEPAMINRVETLKAEVLDNAKLREFAGDTWAAVKASLTEALQDPASALRVGIRSTLEDVGRRLTTDAALGSRIDRWLADTASYVVANYRHEIAGVITETVERWPAAETAAKIELQVGRDLQFIRINGTVVGALAGLVIFTLARAVSLLF
ncbi:MULTISPECIES: DUF445 domain-containing protein [Cryobacterium]|uniref:DUF445 domain-containing protein n=1 Tax=Cryobacterium levicorallinum TaxID=995038 RepID=A0A1I3ATW8_9MICO|nr:MULTISPECIES: DUF445 domain-containing protein [Cryobacterium]TFB87978.1 DUF445 domain-containing protein [Cryobacterium levicorallinum]TFD56383.1 DUF445 domain-containing protein [Cryobacterium sp. Hh38]GEP26835.1 membrane protein [Cryobacterium levicorallinum]SFH53472.1 Uncharacterized membrane-anchored protein YjiN, DUF445 family [Cryobacterium levicorallinum]